MTGISALTLTDFLLARISEEEVAVAQYVQGGAVPLTLGVAYHRVLGMDDLARRVIAECEAKRRIVELHDENNGGCCVCADGAGSADGFAWANPAVYPCETLRALAVPYLDHPDYRQDRRP